ncbi:hypothetical protein ACQSSU_06705 [Micromonospora echinospora]
MPTNDIHPDAQAAINAVLTTNPGILQSIQPRDPGTPEPHWRDITGPDTAAAAPYDAGDAPVASRPLPVHDDLQRARAGRDLAIEMHDAASAAHLDTLRELKQVRADRDQAYQARDVLRAQRDQAIADLQDTRERLHAATTAIAHIRAGIETVDRALAAYDDTDPDDQGAALGSPPARAQDADLAPWIRRAIANPGSIAGPRRGPTWPTNHEGHTDEQESVTDWQTRAVLRILAVGGRPHCELCDQQIAVDDSYDPPLTGIGLWQHTGGCPVRED